jgi:hypothetical protein
MSNMHVLDHTGHTKISWDPDNRSEVAAARTAFEALTKDNKHRAFTVGDDDKKGRRVDTFDPTLEELVMVPHVSGG